MMVMLVSLVWVFAFLASKTVLAISVCDTFRITSPLESNLRWTAGQCYQVSYDVGGLGDTLRDKITIDLHETTTNTKVVNLVKDEQLSSSGATKPFNLNVFDGSASYYYVVTLSRDGIACEPKRTAAFEVNVNLNSPPSQCE